MSDVGHRQIGGKMSLVNHLIELRRRLFIVFGSVLVAFFASWHWARDIYHILMLPMTEVLGEGRSLIFTAPAEAFVTYIKVAIVTAVFAVSPVILWQIWAFIAPGLFKKEQLYTKFVVLIGSFFFVGGALFGYFGVFPLGFKFFIHGFESQDIQAMITVREYFKFSLNILLGFGIAFELPVFVFFLARVGIVTPQWLWRNFRYAVLVIFIGAAIFTPPDIISQVILGVPLTLLYLLATGAAFLVGRKKTSGDDSRQISKDDPSPSDIAEASENDPTPVDEDKS